MTNCTNPDAPFYQADLALISLAESISPTITCTDVTGLVAVFMISLAGLLAVAVWYAVATIH